MAEKTTLNVTGMSCGHCVKTIEDNVGKMDGVKSVQVNLDAGTVDVEFESSQVGMKEISDTIEDQGFDVA